MENFLPSDLEKIANTLMGELDCPRSLTVAILLRYNEVNQLMKLSADPLNYIDSDAYLRATAATDFLRKLEVDGNSDAEKNALVKWYEAEHQCFKTNRRLYRILDGEEIPARISLHIAKTRKFIKSVLGACPGLELQGRFGPGATVSDKGIYVNVANKVTSDVTLSYNCIPFLAPWSSTSWARSWAASERELIYCDTNRYFTVPKTYLTRRSCAVEPSLNGFYQRGYGLLISDRLRNIGVDLSSAQDRHRARAQVGSVSGDWSTIDLSSASDTVSASLVELLLPSDWFEWLNRLRSHSTVVNGRKVRLEKFSSMGNGFTFELETLIFLALLTSMDDSLSPGKDVLVFGDDLIVPTRFGQLACNMLAFYGFSLNPQKTFITGNFRESCGGDFFYGDSVRAYFQKKLPAHPSDWIVCANGIKRLAGQLRDRRLLKTWFLILDQIPTTIRRLRGPARLGDAVIHDSEPSWVTKEVNSIHYVLGYKHRGSKFVPWERFGPDAQMAAVLYGAYPGENASGQKTGWDIRSTSLGYAIGWLSNS